jgi:N,N'-diacetylbacillosaminyl-diphospho-undecaprenol alpha-1,3-N-acetylgalactosaminyltransferase
MQALVAQGHTVYAICPEGEMFHKFKDSGISAIAYTIDRGSINPLKELHAIYKIFEAIKPLKLDILHTFTAKPNIYGTIAAKMAKVPTIINLVEGLGSFYVEDDLRSRLMRFVIESGYKIVFKLSSACVFVNQDDPLYLQQRRVISQAKTVIIKSVGVDTQVFSHEGSRTPELDRLREEINPDNRFMVLMVARAIWHKGIAEFYAAAEQLKEEEILFVLVGGTDEGNPSCADESFLKKGNVRWLGQRSDIKELLSLCDLFVLPSSYREGVPKTLLEAASMQKPIITTDTVGCREVVEDGCNGYLIPVRNSEALAEKILELKREPFLCKKMGISGREKMIEAFDTKIVVKQYLALYKRFEHV